jgi:hypothetical protein
MPRIVLPRVVRVLYQPLLAAKSRPGRSPQHPVAQGPQLEALTHVDESYRM